VKQPNQFRTLTTLHRHGRACPGHLCTTGGT
jgi:hypothetical protein